MTTPAPSLTTEQVQALDVARSLAAAGVPLFLGSPAPGTALGFALPPGWQTTEPDPAIVDAWRPGMALCAVMGRGLDLLDVDPRNGGDPASLGELPPVLGMAATPSGGGHLFIASVGARSRDNFAPGLDFKGGHGGEGHGFAFLAPTVRASKVDGELRPYRWVKEPQVPQVSAGSDPHRNPHADHRRVDVAVDPASVALAERIRALHGTSTRPATGGGPDWWRKFMRAEEPQAQAAADRAITEKLREVIGWQPAGGAGFRAVLMRAAMTLGGYVGGGYLEHDQAVDRLEQACAAVWGDPDADDRLWISQGLADGAEHPFFVYTPEDEQRYGEAAQAVAMVRPPKWTPYTVLGAEPYDPQFCGNDQEHAEALAARMAPVLLYAPDAAVWLKADRDAWITCTELSGWAVSTVARLMPLGNPDLPAKKVDYTEAHWQAHRRNRYMSAAGAGPIEKKYRSLMQGNDHPATVRLDELDADPEILWAGGLPWDLRASRDEPTLSTTQSPHGPHLHTARYLPAAVPTPRFDAFLAAVWPDAEVRAWALRVLSVALAGYPDAVLPVLYGPGRTGKTALVSLLIDLLGSYGIAADPRLLGGADNAHASIIYALKGARLAFIDEGPRRGHLATERLKQLTGGGKLTGNQMRANPVTFEATHTLVMTTNDEPVMTDPALRDRLRVIPCEADPGAVRRARQAITPAVWAAEAPGVLARLITECAAWLADRDSAGNEAAPLALREATEEMAATQDPVTEWVELRTLPAEPGTQARVLYNAFAAWFEGQPALRRTPLPTETAFGRTLTRLGFPSSRGFGPKGNLLGRPLSVFGGDGAWSTPQGPMPSAQAPAGQPSAPLGSDAGVAEAENARSSGVFSSSSDSSASTSLLSTTTEDTHTYTQKLGETGEVPAGRGASGKNSGLPAQTPVSAGAGVPEDSGDQPFAAQVRERLRRSTTVSGPAPADDPAPRPSRARLTPEEKAARAQARRLEREQAKIAKRLAAIEAAAGETHPLPVAVDRAGRIVPCSVDQAVQLVRLGIAATGSLTVDVETSGFPVGHRDYALRTVQLGHAALAVVLDPVAHAAAIGALLAEAPVLHAHSATADLVPLAHAGLIDPETGWARMRDTVIPAKLADPQSTGSDPGLKQLAGTVLGEQATAPAADEARAALFKAGGWLEKTEVDTPVERSGWAQVVPGCATMARYAASDVLDTAELAVRLPAAPEALVERERAVQRVTARITHRGLALDPVQVRTLTERHRAGEAEHGAVLARLGVENPGSSLQVAAAAASLGASLPTTKTGKPSAAKDVLEGLRGSEGALGELVEAELAWRHHNTALKLFLVPWQHLIDHGDGRVRPTIYTLGTDTGRMSAVRPNLQQLSREGGIRACITADPGQLLISADFSGVELRVAAALSGDVTLRQLLAEEDRFTAEVRAREVHDGVSDKEARRRILAERGWKHAGRADGLHWEVARMVFGEAATKADRYNVKRMVFGRLYGGGIPTLAKQTGVNQSVTASVVDSLDALTPGLAAWSAHLRDFVKAGGTQFPSYSGRIIHFPKEFPHKAPNYCVGMSTPVLRADLTHVPASTIKVGDRLVGFDEHPQEGAGGQNRYHHLRTAVVEAVSTVVKPSLRVRTADGKVTECSTDHLWLVRPLKGRKNNRPRVRWVRADELRPGDDLLSLGTWDVADNRTAGYVAGLYDGEGSLTRHAGGRRKNQLFFSQNRGPVMNAMRSGMIELGLPYSYYDRPPNSTSTTDSVVVSGLRNVMRTLGTLQPARFRERFEELYEGNAITAGLTESVAVVAIEDAGEIELASIQTSTRTLVANGYLSHNCIQGTARELTMDAILRWAQTEWGTCTLLPVHDELDVAVPAQDAERATAELVRCMETELHGVRISAEASAPSYFWADSV